jgi:hypothetical protein
MMLFNFFLLLQSLAFKNFTLKSEFLFSVFPTGDYKTMYFLTNSLEQSILNLTVISSLKSSNRDTFG